MKAQETMDGLDEGWTVIGLLSICLLIYTVNSFGVGIDYVRLRGTSIRSPGMI